MFDFPASPITGQTFQPAGGPLYQFNGYAWVSAPVASGFMALKRTVVTALGTTTAFQFDAKTQYADVEVIGAGGGGGSSAAGAGAGLGTAGAGGGGGGYAKKLITVDATVRANTKSIVVAAGGTSAANAGSSSYTDGVNTLTANGGVAGGTGVFNATIVTRLGGAGGSATGGDVNIGGGSGMNGISLGSVQCGTNASAAMAGNGGNGGNGGGGGAGGGLTSSTSATGANGSPATGWGGGGGGGCAQNLVGAVPSGGTGGPSVVIITEYFATQAPAGIAIDEAPSDGNEYVRVNGVWRLKHQSFSPGTNGVNIPVPATAKRAKIKAWLIGATTGLMPVIRCSTDGSTYYNGASDYIHAGSVLYTGSSGSPTKVGAVSTSYMHLGAGAYTDRVDTTIYLDVDLVVGKVSGDNFGFRSRLACYHTASTAGFQEALIQGYSNWANYLTQTQLAAFQIINAGGTFEPSPASVIDVEWVY